MQAKFHVFCLIAFISIACSSKSIREKEIEDSLHVDSLASSKNTDDFSFDPLKKYSYELIPLIHGQLIGGATSFFVKKDNYTILVSNYHVFTDFNTNTGMPNADLVDTLVLKYLKTNDNFIYYDTIDIKSIREKNKPCFYYNCPDVYAIKISLPKNAEIFYVNEYLNPELYYNVTPLDVMFYGFNTDEGEFQFGSVYKDLKGDISSPDGSVTKNCFLISAKAAPGFSGSPVFIKYRDERDKKVKVFLGGIEFNEFPKSRLVSAVRVQYIREAVDRALTQ